jgi:hypothetical protein
MLQRKSVKSAPNTYDESVPSPKQATTKPTLLQSLFATTLTQSSKGDNKNKAPSFQRLRAHLERSRWSRWMYVSSSSVLFLILVYIPWRQNRVSLPPSERDQCWLQAAFHRGEFMVGSHRSLLGDSQLARPPSCMDALRLLNATKIHYLDLDLIYDPATERIVVAHPMEFQGTTDFYSPCAKQPLETMLVLMKQAMPTYFVSLEPKADWDRDKGNPILKEPALLLQEIIRVMLKLNVRPNQCSLYVDFNKVLPAEEPLLDQLANHCTFGVLKVMTRRGLWLNAATTSTSCQQLSFIRPIPTMRLQREYNR